MVLQTIESLRDYVYDNFIHNFIDPNFLSSCLIMAGLNRMCREENRKMLDQLPREVIE